MLFPLVSVVNAQSAGSCQLSGFVRDTGNNKAVMYATVTVTDSSQQTIATVYSLENGSFKFTLPLPGTYTLEISSVGYKTAARSIVVTEGQLQSDIGTVFLISGSEYLQEVKVTARKRLVDQKPGMLIYNAENDITNKGGTAADVLRKAPVLSVDAQGNVTMRGSGNLKILINGKYSGQMARSAADALNMMPAAMIRSVEIITTPSAKYDAEGAAGVINIITKKGKNDLSGALEASVSNLEQMFNPRLAYSRNKWSINLAGHLHRLRSKSIQELGRTSAGSNNSSTDLQQKIEKDNAAPHGSADLNIDYSIDETSELSLGINGWFGKWPDNSNMSSLVRGQNGLITEQYLQDILQKGSYLGVDINLGYNKRMKRQGQMISLLIQRSPSRDKSDYNAAQTNLNKEVFYREVNNSTTKNGEWTFQADYVHPLNKKSSLLLESGAKLILRSVGNQYALESSDALQPDVLVPQPDRTDHFRYSQDVLAGYAMFKVSLPANWYIESGARVEATYIKGKFIHTGTSFDNQFVNFVPTATITKKIDERHTVNFSYTRRLTRPYIWDLNPNINTSDPKNIESGNPNLQPEMADQAEMSYSLNTGQSFFLNAAAFWKRTNDAIIEFMETDANGVSYTSKQNLANNTQYGMNLSATANFTSRWMVNGNVNLNHLDFSSGALAVFRKGWGADFNLNTTYKLPKDFSVQAFGEYSTRVVTLLGSSGRFYYYSFAGRKEFKKTRMAVTLAAINPFAGYVSQINIRQRFNFSSSADTRYYNRAVKLTINWELGGVRQQQKQRKKIENTDVKIQGKG
jgi:outer membrane receptor protein involved in Fe transport